MKRSSILSIVQAAIAIVILILIFRTIDFSQALSLLGQLDLWFLLLAAFCYFLNNLLMAYRLKKILYEMGENIRLRLVFFSHMAGMLLSDFTPARSGYLYAALALNKRDVPLEKGVASLTSTYVYDLTFKMIVAILGAYFLYSFIFGAQLGLAILVTLLLIGGVIGGYYAVMHPGVRMRRIFESNRLLNKILGFGDQSRSIQKCAPLITSVTLVGWLLRGLQWYLIVLAMGQVFLTPLDALLLNPLLTLLSLVPLTPGGWGIQEAGIVAVFTAMGISATIAASFALLTRLVEVAVDLLGMKELFSKPLKTETLFSYYNTIEGNIDEKAYNSDMLVQRYFQRRKTEAIRDAANIMPDDVLIDIGCGSGIQIREIGTGGYRFAVGIDVSLNAVKYAREKAPENTDFIIADAQHLPLKPACATKIVCAEIIEHLKSPDALVSEIKRVLGDGGIVVITTPNDRSVWGFYELLWDIFGRGRNYGETHLRFFSEGGLKASFATFSSVSTATFFFLSPLFALTGSTRLLDIGIRLDRPFERHGHGVSILLRAEK